MERFQITTYNYSNSLTLKDFNKWTLPNIYHAIYILEKGREAYLGISSKPKRRAYEHLKKYEKYNFHRMHIITGKRTCQ